MAVTIITINGIEWTVFFVDKMNEHLVDENGKQNAYGIALLREGEINIDDGFPKGLMLHKDAIIGHMGAKDMGIITASGS